MSNDWTSLEERLGYRFADRDLLSEALTHPSYAYEKGGGRGDNQRLEYLGDAVLQLVISEHLYRDGKQEDEGRMTKMRADLVCEPTLTLLARSLGLGDQLKLGRGESLSGGADNPSNLSDAMEALIGALYLDGGMERTRERVLALFAPYIDMAFAGQLTYDHKSRLFEWAQSRPDTRVLFSLLQTQGPEHDRIYRVGLYIRDRLEAEGQGRTIKAAEQDAARIFFDKRGEN